MPLLVSWLVVLAWLVVMVLAQLHFSWLWFSGSANPRRHEALIGVAMASFYALPAVLAVAFFRWRHWGDSPAIAKRLAVVLVSAALVLFVAALAVS